EDNHLPWLWRELSLELPARIANVRRDNPFLHHFAGGHAANRAGSRSFLIQYHLYLCGGIIEPINGLALCVCHHGGPPPWVVLCHGPEDPEPFPTHRAPRLCVH